jgi:hypothetical protein
MRNIMSSVWGFIRTHAKAVVAFLVTALAQAIVDAVKTGGGLPTTWSTWGTFLITSLSAAVFVWITGNKLDTNQVVAATSKLPVDGQVQVAQGALTQLPNPVSDQVVAGYPDWAAGSVPTS